MSTLSKAIDLLESQQYKEAQELLEELAMDNPKDADVLYYDHYGRMVREKLTKPYYDFPFLREAKSLSKQTDETLGDEYTTDIATVNLWAESFGVRNWFTWTDFEDVPANYGLVH